MVYNLNPGPAAGSCSRVVLLPRGEGSWMTCSPPGAVAAQPVYSARGELLTETLTQRHFTQSSSLTELPLTPPPPPELLTQHIG